MPKTGLRSDYQQEQDRREAAKDAAARAAIEGCAAKSSALARPRSEQADFDADDCGSPNTIGRK